MREMSGWTFHEGELGRDDVRALLDFHFAEMRGNSPPEACHVLPTDGLAGQEISFWSVREDGHLLGIGALKELSDDHGEIKSMRTAPGALGRGVGTAMLSHILGEARRRGYRRVSLETGCTEPFAAALRLYEREGFVPCGPFGGYPDTPFTRFFTLEL
jgi:putative acetyltransferase